MLWRTHPEQAEKFLEQSQREVLHRYHYYEQLASIEWNKDGDIEPPHRKLKASIEETASKKTTAIKTKTTAIKTTEQTS